jgi:hypothetical protein
MNLPMMIRKGGVLLWIHTRKVGTEGGGELTVAWSAVKQ